MLLLLGANRGRSVDGRWRRIWKGGATEEGAAHVDDMVRKGEEGVEECRWKF